MVIYKILLTSFFILLNPLYLAWSNEEASSFAAVDSAIKICQEMGCKPIESLLAGGVGANVGYRSVNAGSSRPIDNPYNSSPRGHLHTARQYISSGVIRQSNARALTASDLDSWLGDMRGDKNSVRGLIPRGSAFNLGNGQVQVSMSFMPASSQARLAFYINQLNQEIRQLAEPHRQLSAPGRSSSSSIRYNRQLQELQKILTEANELAQGSSRGAESRIRTFFNKYNVPNVFHISVKGTEKQITEYLAKYAIGGRSDQIFANRADRFKGQLRQEMNRYSVAAFRHADPRVHRMRWMRTAGGGVVGFIAGGILVRVMSPKAADASEREFSHEPVGELDLSIGEGEWVSE